MLIKEIGEFNLIDRMSAIIGTPKRPLVAGIGDDCAVLYPPKEKLQLVTTDMLVEDVHFSLSTASPYQIGWKSLAANISDIAAMGGEPTFAFVSVGFPKNTTAEFIDDLYLGMKKIAESYEVDIVGGDTVSSPEIIINIALLGEVESGNQILRSGAKAGDAICVTGDVGGSSAGLAILQNSLSIEDTEKHLMPIPRVTEGRLLAKSHFVNAMIDISDGVASEVHHICKQSRTGAELYMAKIPLSPNVIPVAKQLEQDPCRFALYGGEDYELLFTCQYDKVDILREQIAQRCNTPITLIGRIIDNSSLITIEDEIGEIAILKPRGYDHFTPSE
jgi:thiamine-monophosphate kinase